MNESQPKPRRNLLLSWAVASSIYAIVAAILLVFVERRETPQMSPNVA